MTRRTASSPRHCRASASRTPSPKSLRLIRSDHVWDLYKQDIRQMYVEQDMSLKATMEIMEAKYDFKHSPRKWKMKMKEWKFEKHIPANEMIFMATKSDERKADASNPKDTIFVRGDITIMQDRIANFKKLKRGELTSPTLPIDPSTPPNVRYYTPDPEPHEEIDFSEVRASIQLDMSEEPSGDSTKSVLSEDQIDISVQSLNIQEALAERVESSQVLIANWAWTFKYSYSSENGSQLYQETLQLACLEDADSPDLQKIKLLASELLEPFGRFGISRRFGTRDPNAEILFRATELANGCSEAGWYDAADSLFGVLMNGSLATFDRVGRKFDKIRSYIWHARHQQRQGRWEESVETLLDAYRILTSTLLFSGNAVEYHKLSDLLKSALDGISPSWRFSSRLTQLDALVEMDMQLDAVIQDNKAAGMGSPRLNCNSAANSSSNPGRYGVTYSESMMSGISFNYSALFL
ncbi:hypothetical protein BKA61DRAFT_238295 [Leptodontidium sp. MPI-SDFR-AT-0119]|nr:hypothetical protein BKA61DRAFT_238295 [Leptodontidium sp. MPI-SDFR-AT-0119]